MMHRARSLPLALAIAGIVAWLPTRGVPQETRETTDSSAEHAASSIEALFETALGETVSLEESPCDRAIRLVHEKIKADKRLQGGYYEFQAKRRLLNEVELQRGRKELRRMLRDRRKMARGLTAEDELFQWAVRKFAGEDLPTWIEWRKTSDDPYGFEASHRPPTDRAPGAVFVREARVPYLLQWKGSDHSFDTLWCHAAFELHNIQSHRQFRELHGKAIAGKIARDDYILGEAKLEFHALLRTRLFYVEEFYPWAKERSIETNPYNWFLGVPDSFDQWITKYPRGSVYPWQVYGDYFDRFAHWRQHHRKTYEETIRLHIRTKAWDQLWDALRRESLKREQRRQLWNKLAERTQLATRASSGVSCRGG